MKKNRILLSYGVFLLLQLLLGLCILKDTGEEKLDAVLVNDIAKSIYSQWEALEAGEDISLLDSWKQVDFTVLEKDGGVLMATKEGMSASVFEAIAARDTIVDIGEKNRTVGKLLVENPNQKRTAQHNRLVFGILLAGSLFEILLLFLHLCFLERTLIRPFQKLKAFAVRVAKGNLDLPLQMDRGNVFGAFTESFDLMREELKKSRQREQEANRSKKELVAKLSHDIKTPIASIQAVSELMLVSAETEKEIGQLTVIQKKAEQIDRLISNLFHAALEELSELTVTPREHSSYILGELIRTADYQGQTVVPDIPPCMLIFDKVRLQQVFDNIFSNSYKYAASPIRTAFWYEEDFFCIGIADEGPGVSGEECALLFEKYFRGKNAEEQSGAGLGLFISRFLLQQMGGKITCANQNPGFQVKVCLKLA